MKVATQHASMKRHIFLIFHALATLKVWLQPCLVQIINTHRCLATETSRSTLLFWFKLGKANKYYNYYYMVKALKMIKNIKMWP